MKKWIFLAIVLMPLTASAEFMRFEFDGICTFECDQINLNFGDPVSGFVETLTGLDDDDILWFFELSDFGFNFGPWIEIDDSTHFPLGALVLNEAGTGLFGSDLFEGMTFQQLTNPSTGATTGSISFLDLDGWIANGRFFGCFGDCDYFHLAGGPGTYTKVPAPGTLGLFGIGLVALGLTRRRNRIGLN